MIEVRFKLAGQEWSEPKTYPLDRLQELMDRANAAFGDPSVNLGGPSTSLESEVGSAPIQKRRRKK